MSEKKGNCGWRLWGVMLPAPDPECVYKDTEEYRLRLKEIETKFGSSLSPREKETMDTVCAYLETVRDDQAYEYSIVRDNRSIFIEDDEIAAFTSRRMADIRLRKAKAACLREPRLRDCQDNIDFEYVAQIHDAAEPKLWAEAAEAYADKLGPIAELRGAASLKK